MSRELTFWNDETIQLIRENFVAVSIPTWVCRTMSPEGEFLRSANIHHHWVTSGGYMHCVSASGRLLGGQPCAEVLEEFAKLPENERLPGAITVPELKPGEAVVPDPPKGGLVLRVHARFLSRDESGQLRYATAFDFPLMRRNPEVIRVWRTFLEPNTEYMWITRDEWQALVPADPVKGGVVEVPSSIAMRLARFHLTPQRATTSEGGIIPKRSVRTAELHMTIEDTSPATIHMKLDGFVHWGSDFDAAKATTPNGPLEQGFEAPVVGYLEYDRRGGEFTRFDMVAVGDVWGRWGDANGNSMYVERPGRNPFGFALELATGETPTDRIPPGGSARYISEETGYFSEDR